MNQAMIFNYDAFIKELIQLVERAEKFTISDKVKTADSFRKWEHEANDLIYRIERQKYNINCNLRGRLFEICGYGSYSKLEQQNVFDRELQDTLNEMKLVIENYKKYGDPKREKTMHPPATQSLNAKELEWPDKVNFKWLRDYMPASVWYGLLIAFIGVGGTTYGIGHWVGSTFGAKAESQNEKTLPTPNQESTKPTESIKNKKPQP